MFVVLFDLRITHCVAHAPRCFDFLRLHIPHDASDGPFVTIRLPLVIEEETFARYFSYGVHITMILFPPTMST